MAAFHQQLKHYREQKNMSQEELAIKARLGRQTIEKYEAGEKIPDTQTILKLSTVLDVPASELISKEELAKKQS